jgi:hypothetical protein
MLRAFVEFRLVVCVFVAFPLNQKTLMDAGNNDHAEKIYRAIDFEVIPNK